MRFRSLVVAILIAAIGLSGTAWAQDDQAVADRQAIESCVASYVEAFNSADAEALAAHWSDSAEYLAPSGERLAGRKTLAEYFSTMFANSPGMKLEVQVNHLRFPSDNVAIEEGTARVTMPVGPPNDTSYLAVHVRHDGKWQLDTVREVSLNTTSDGNDNADRAPAAYDRLKDLEWMIGEWRDADDESQVTIVGRWTANRTFITRSFQVTIAGQLDLEGTQVIGWDPVMGQIRSWVFDSDGGTGDGLWTREGDQWVIQSRATLRDGRQATAVQIITLLDGDHFLWESTQREVEGELLPNIEPVNVSRSATLTETPVEATEGETP